MFAPVAESRQYGLLPLRGSLASADHIRSHSPGCIVGFRQKVSGCMVPLEGVLIAPVVQPSAAIWLLSSGGHSDSGRRCKVLWKFARSPFAST